jgi:hypothetical protein
LSCAQARVVCSSFVVAVVVVVVVVVVGRVQRPVGPLQGHRRDELERLAVARWITRGV